MKYYNFFPLAKREREREKKKKKDKVGIGNIEMRVIKY